MAKEFEKKEAKQKPKKVTWSFISSLETGKELKEYAAKYNMSLGEYIEAVHKRYVESIQKK